MKSEILNWINETRSRLDELEAICKDATYAEIKTLIEGISDNADEVDSQIANCSEREEDKQNCEKVYLDLVKIIPEGEWRLNKDSLNFEFKPNSWDNNQCYCISFDFYGDAINLSLGGFGSSVINGFEILGDYPNVRVGLNKDNSNCYEELLKIVNYWIEQYPQRDIVYSSSFTTEMENLHRRYINKLSDKISIKGKWRTITPSEFFVYELKFTPASWSSCEIKFLFNEADSTITYLLQMQKGIDTPSNWIEQNEKYRAKYENKSIFTGELKPCEFYSEFEKNVVDFIQMVEAGEKIENC